MRKYLTTLVAAAATSALLVGCSGGVGISNEEPTVTAEKKDGKSDKDKDDKDKKDKKDKDKKDKDKKGKDEDEETSTKSTRSSSKSSPTSSKSSASSENRDGTYEGSTTAGELGLSAEDPSIDPSTRLDMKLSITGTRCTLSFTSPDVPGASNSETCTFNESSEYIQMSSGTGSGTRIYVRFESNGDVVLIDDVIDEEFRLKKK